MGEGLDSEDRGGPKATRDQPESFVLRDLQCVDKSSLTIFSALPHHRGVCHYRDHTCLVEDP